MNTEAMHQTLEGSLSGKLTFPQVVGILASAGVESYSIDLIRGEDVFYMPDGVVHVEKMTPPATPIPENFSQPGLVAAIRAAQADTIRYPEFLTQAMAAGVAGYRTYITGKRVLYLGRKGDLHIEEFPRPRA